MYRSTLYWFFADNATRITPQQGKTKGQSKHICILAFAQLNLFKHFHEPDFYTDIQSFPAKNAYLFSSVGRFGIISKIVIFQKLSQAGFFNLFLGDYTDNGIADDWHITNNGDMPKVLATVVQIIHKFTTEHANCRIVITGSDTVRRRLYARVILNNYETIRKDYNIECKDSYDEPFKVYEPTGIGEAPYSFLISRKRLNLES